MGGRTAWPGIKGLKGECLASFDYDTTALYPWSMELYKAEVPRALWGISQRCIDYWVTTGLIQPSRVAESPRGRRVFFFSFQELLLIRTIKALRGAGISLQRIREVVRWLRSQGESPCERAWLVTDGRSIFQLTDDIGTLRSLEPDERGQLAFAVVRTSPFKSELEAGLAANPRFSVDLARYKGTTSEWTAVAE